MVDKTMSVKSNMLQEALIANLRVEVVIQLLIEKGIITEEEFKSNSKILADEKEKQYNELIKKEK